MKVLLLIIYLTSAQKYNIERVEYQDTAKATAMEACEGARQFLAIVRPDYRTRCIPEVPA